MEMRRSCERERERESLIPSSCVKLRLNYVTKFQQSVERRPKLWRNNAMIIKAFAADSDKPSIDGNDARRVARF